MNRSLFASVRVTSLALLLVTAEQSQVGLFAGGPNSVDAGWVIDNSGNVLLTPALAASYVAGKSGWLRVNMRLINGNTSWNSTMLSYYDAPINNARNAGLQVFILIGGEAGNGGQSSWNGNNYECNGGNGQNAYIDAFVTNAVAPIIAHFHDRVKVYEIWNEPSTWQTQSGNCISGATYVYPSCYSWMLNKSWINAHITQGFNDVTIISGGVFGTSAQGASDPGGNSGSNYVDAVYTAGLNPAINSFTPVMNAYGSYPLDGIGQHLYIDYNTTTSTRNVQQYLDLVRGAYTKYEGTGTPKQTWMTEFGWSTAYVSQSTQAANLKTAFSTMNVGGSGSYVALASWFDWQDNAAAGLYFGVFDVNGNAKLSYPYPYYQFYEQYEGYYSGGTTNTAILNYFNSLGQAALGDAYDNGGTAYVHSWGIGNVQDFDGGSHSRLAIMNSSSGTFEVIDLHGLWDYYLANNGVTVFGYPTDNEYASGSGTRQDFNNGYLLWDPTSGISWTATPTASPTNLRATVSNQRGKITLSWTQTTNPTVTQNKVYRSTLNGGPYSLIVSLNATTSYVNTGLTSGQTYYYVVTAVNSAGQESAYSNQASATAK